MEQDFRQIEEAVMEVLRQLEVMVRTQDERLRRLEGVSFANREEEIIGSSPEEVEWLKAHPSLDCLPPTKDVPVTKTKEGQETDTGGITFPPEVWNVIDKNWEALKDAVCKIKAGKEKSGDIPLSVLEDIPLPVEALAVLDKHFDELAKLFRI